MRTRHKILVLLCTLFFTMLATASQEGVLVLGSFHIESPGTGASGPVAISGTQGSRGLRSLTVEAFGKKYELNAIQLKELSGILVNNVQISYEAGYKELGGRTIYIQFAQGFTSGVVTRKLVVVTASGTVEVGVAP